MLLLHALAMELWIIVIQQNRRGARIEPLYSPQVKSHVTPMTYPANLSAVKEEDWMRTGQIKLEIESKTKVGDMNGL